MQLEFFIANKLTPSTLIPQIEKECQSLYEWKAFKQYYPCKHSVLDKTKRQDKQIQVPMPGSHPDAEGNYPTQTKVVPLNRIPLALQKLIVSRKTAFVTGGDVVLKAKTVTDTDKKLYDQLQETWRKNKLQYKNSEIFKRMVSETEAAEIWYSQVNEDKTVTLRCNIYSPEKGYSLYPVFDAHEDLIAFGLGYKAETTEGTVEYFDLYDALEITKYVCKSGENWAIREDEIIDGKIQSYPRENPYGKIPVIYYQSTKAWEDVQWLIERLETLMSNFGDVNDYNGSPILFAKGDIEGFSSKGETGKVLQGNGDGADIKYISWDHAPESIKLEIETLENYIYTITQTPNISFKEMKDLGQALSGVAMDRMFIDAHLNAKDYHNGCYGEGIQRRINFLKAALVAANKDLKASEDLDITAQFSLFSIDNDEDKINIAMKANGNLPVMSQKESIQYVGLTDDVEQTLSELQPNNTVTT